MASPEERAPAPAGWPGMAPVTDSEPEPEIEMGTEETPEAELEQLEPAEEQGDRRGGAPSTASDEGGDSGPRPPAGAGGAQPAGTGGSTPDGTGGFERASPDRSSDDVRKELRSYLNGVRGRLDQGGGHSSPGRSS